eukprot:6205789-Pleurochrysis_carterae.AAC.4
MALFIDRTAEDALQPLHRSAMLCMSTDECVVTRAVTKLLARSAGGLGAGPSYRLHSCNYTLDLGRSLWESQTIFPYLIQTILEFCELGGLLNETWRLRKADHSSSTMSPKASTNIFGDSRVRVFVETLYVHVLRLRSGHARHALSRPGTTRTPHASMESWLLGTHHEAQRRMQAFEPLLCFCIHWLWHAPNMGSFDSWPTSRAHRKHASLASTYVFVQHHMCRLAMSQLSSGSRPMTEMLLNVCNALELLTDFNACAAIVSLP